jgi:hypothetical protein
MPAAVCRSAVLPLIAAVVLAACGGGGGGTVEPAAVAPAPRASPAAAPTPPAAPVPAPDPIAAAPGHPARIAAATATAGSDANDCAAIRPFYWEMGDRDQGLAGASVDVAGADPAVTADSELRLASATKWIYAAYVAQRRGGQLLDWDRRMLSLRAGYVQFSGCRADQTVEQCLAWQANDQFTPDADGRFYYGGGHLQKHASLLGLGALDAGQLAAEMRSVLGQDLAFGMTQAWPGGGATGTPALYARFLRKLLGGELALGSMLGSAPGCASVSGCPTGEALYAPTPAGETWHYSLGHWVEDDPVRGDGAFSNAGAFGFYAWVDSQRSHYGIVARDVARGGTSGAGAQSARCGRLIRQAWTTGVAR